MPALPTCRVHKADRAAEGCAVRPAAQAPGEIGPRDGDTLHRRTQLIALSQKVCDMGMQQAVTFTGAVPAWAGVCEALRRAGQSVPGMRMIDGEIALPDESPSAQWRELRVAWADGGGMITVQRIEPAKLALVVWGNADATLQQGWHRLTWAFAHVGEGRVETDGETYAPADFAKAKGLAV